MDDDLLLDEIEFGLGDKIIEDESFINKFDKPTKTLKSFKKYK